MSETEEKQVKGGDFIQLAGSRVTSNEELLELFHAHLGLQKDEKISKLSYDVLSNEWTIDYRPVN